LARAHPRTEKPYLVILSLLNMDGEREKRGQYNQVRFFRRLIFVFSDANI